MGFGVNGKHFEIHLTKFVVDPAIGARQESETIQRFISKIHKNN